MATAIYKIQVFLRKQAVESRLIYKFIKFSLDFTVLLNLFSEYSSTMLIH